MNNIFKLALWVCLAVGLCFTIWFGISPMLREQQSTILYFAGTVLLILTPMVGANIILFAYKKFLKGLEKKEN